MTRKHISVLATLLLLVCSMWGREDRMHSSTVTPAAEGKIVTSADRSGNTKVHVTVHHLADPSKLAPAQTAYIVWIQPRGEQAQMAGKLRVNEDLDGTLDTVVPYKDFDVIITAETQDKPDMPSSMEVLRGTVER